jgi:hypothetical protein
MDFQSGHIRFVDFSYIGMRVAEERNMIRSHFRRVTGKENENIDSKRSSRSNYAGL